MTFKLTPNRLNLSHRFTQRLTRLLPVAVAALAATMPMAGHASGGDALDIELPSMRTPVQVAPALPVIQATPAVSASAATTDIAMPTETPALTRAQVRETLQNARAANLLTPDNEIGDTPEILAAREDFYVLQTEVLTAEYQRVAEAQQLALTVQDSTYQEVSQQVSQQALTGPDGAADQPWVQGMAPQDQAALDQAREQALTQGAEATVVTEVQVPPGMTVAEVMSQLEATGQDRGVIVLLLSDPEQDNED